MPSNVSITGDDALTLDMVGQYTYRPRRFHLMYVEGRWDDNAYTIEGRHVDLGKVGYAEPLAVVTLGRAYAPPIRTMIV